MNNPSRERFELGLFEARAAISGNLGGSQMTQCNCVGPQNGEPACPCAMNQQRQFFAQFERKFFNTTKESGPQLAEYQAKAGDQNETVLAIFHKANRPLSPSQVLEWYRSVPGGCGKPLPPLTSIRRAMTTLTQAGALVKTDTKRKGVLGRNEFCWRLPTGGSEKSDSGACASSDG